jgi:hypothetical protein
MKLTKNKSAFDAINQSVTDPQARPRNPFIHNMAARPIDSLLSRLQLVRKSGRGRWMARCPAHEDKHPSLSLAETSDGTVLVKCFAGCSLSDITDAVGVHLSQLFPPKLTNHRSSPIHHPCFRQDVFDLLRGEAEIVWLIARDMRAKRDISERDYDRLCQAVAKLERIADAGYKC